MAVVSQEDAEPSKAPVGSMNGNPAIKCKVNLPKNPRKRKSEKYP
jgi:hypothetical protein